MRQQPSQARPVQADGGPRRPSWVLRGFGMRGLRGWITGMAVSAALLTAGASEAAPFTYTFLSGSVTLTASINGNPLITPITRPLTGVQVTVN